MAFADALDSLIPWATTNSHDVAPAPSPCSRVLIVSGGREYLLRANAAKNRKRAVRKVKLGKKREVIARSRHVWRHRLAEDGPAIVDQLDTTTVVFPRQVARVDRFGNLIVRLE